MRKVKDKSIELEILIATMNRTTLDFLSKMFSGQNYLDFNVLIINQTIDSKLLKSECSNIRVINTFEKGLSKSRNIAIKNATKPICLLADDDIVFNEGFENLILKAHQDYPYPIITFQTQTTNNEMYWDYPLISCFHNENIREKTLSIEITFKKEELKELGFDERFGLGSIFEDGENYIFLSEAKKKKMKLWFVNNTLSMHNPISSSDDVKSNRLLYAKSAIHFYKYGNLSYFWVFKFIFFIYRKKYISFNEISSKIKIGFKGINDFKNIN
tara:strand:+ start:2450 stop:3262 length:813 start_codon:yes stop_codon:yes gene_type:complete